MSVLLVSTPHTDGISLVDKLQRKYETIEERPVRVCGLCRQNLALDVINAWIIGTENTSAREMLVLAVMAGWSRPQKGQRTGRLKGDGKVAAAIVQPGIVLVQDKHESVWRSFLFAMNHLQEDGKCFGGDQMTAVSCPMTSPGKAHQQTHLRKSQRDG